MTSCRRGGEARPPPLKTSLGAKDAHCWNEGDKLAIQNAMIKARIMRVQRGRRRRKDLMRVGFTDGREYGMTLVSSFLW